MRHKKGYGMKKDKGTKIAGGPSFEIRPIEPDAPRMPDAESKRIWNKFTQTNPEGARLKRNAERMRSKYSI